MIKSCVVPVLVGVGALLMTSAPIFAAPVARPLVGGLPMADGPFDGTQESLSQYRYPDWFRNAKFGIWAHWGPQSVAMEGDWYARHIYEQGSSQNQYHIEHYGPPSKFGYKDIIPLWKAEKWNPDQLMDLYVKAGAKYFVSMGVHHDNFDLWNSKYNRWNAVNMGPHRDVVGDWQRAAKKHGLPFGVSEHLGASYTWYQASHGADKTGPLAGVPYDGADPKYFDLYHNPAAPGDTGWLTNSAANQADWQRRIRDLIDQYHPDLLYSDSGFPFESVGAGLVSHFYNSNRAQHGGRLEAVYNCKQESGGKWVQDVERGVLDKISPQPWQTDTSMGDWFYSRHQGYKTPATVVHMLCDIVSKNGNLLLNIVQRPDGSIDDASQEMLRELAAWMPVNGEAIYGTRPWTVFGEGTPAQGGSFHEDSQDYSARDIRFTRKGDAIYAILLGYPTGNAVIKALAADSPFVSGQKLRVELLGYHGVLPWKRTEAGLEITPPAQPPTKYAVVFKITGLKTIANVTPEQMDQWKERLMPGPDQTVRPETDGSLLLTPDKAHLHGNGIKLQGDGAGRNIGFWDNAADFVSWDKIAVAAPGTYDVQVQVATINPQSSFSLEIGGQKLVGQATSTGDWSAFKTIDLGPVEIKNPGDVSATLRAVSAGWMPINIASVHLIK